MTAEQKLTAALPVTLPPIAYPGLSMLCVVRKMTDAEVTAATFSENTGKPLSAMDLAMFAYHNDKLGIGQKEIARLMSTAHHRMSASRVSVLLNLIRLPLKIQKLLHANQIPESACQALLRLGLSAEELELRASDVAAGRIKPSEITAEANAARRAKGIKVQRNIADLRRMMERLPFQNKLQVTPGELLDWLDGGVGDEVWTNQAGSNPDENMEDEDANISDDNETEAEPTGAYELVNGRPVKLADVAPISDEAREHLEQLHSIK